MEQRKRKQALWQGYFARQVAIGLRNLDDIEAICQVYDCTIVESLENLNAYIVRSKSSNDLLAGITLANALRTDERIRYADVQIMRFNKLLHTPNDPEFSSQQWHINGSSSADMNVRSAWDTAKGNGITIAIIDDGVDLDHEDLVTNKHPGVHKDFVDADNDPSPGTADYHGTMVAGCAAARGDNNLGGSGIAPEAQILGIRLLGASQFGDSLTAQAFSYMTNSANTNEQIAVSNNSWGIGIQPNEPNPSPEDIILARMAIAIPGTLTTDALKAGVENGRNAKGVVYLFASGNSRLYNNADRNNDSNDNFFDSVDYDLLGSNRHSMAIGVVNSNGQAAGYSEAGGALFLSAPSGEFHFTKGQFTTDKTGPSTNEKDFDGEYVPSSAGLSGTSFACPNASGGVAVLLSANPELTYRDVQHILQESAKRINASDSDWITNAAGVKHHRRYGFGLMDVGAAVTLAEDWAPVPDLMADLSADKNMSSGRSIPDSGSLSSTISVPSTSTTQNMFIERVQLTVDIKHSHRGDLSYMLISPSGTSFEIHHRPYDANADLDHTFTILPFWGESPNGAWTLIVKDNLFETAGTLEDWSLNFIGFQKRPFINKAAMLDDTNTEITEIPYYNTDISLRLGGASFETDTVFKVGTTALVSTFINAETVNVDIPASLMAIGEDLVISAGGDPTEDSMLRLPVVSPPTPQIISSNPPTITSRSSQRIDLTGLYFHQAASDKILISVNGQSVGFAIDSKTTANFTPSDSQLTGDFITVTIKETIGNTSSTFTIPIIDGADPAIAYATSSSTGAPIDTITEAGPIDLYLFGGNFNSSTVVSIGGLAVSTVYNAQAPQYIKASIQEYHLSNRASIAVSVTDGNSITLNILRPPVLTAGNPNPIIATEGEDQDLTITGSNLINGETLFYLHGQGDDIANKAQFIASNRLSFVDKNTLVLKLLSTDLADYDNITIRAQNFYHPEDDSTKRDAVANALSLPVFHPLSIVNSTESTSSFTLSGTLPSGAAAIRINGDLHDTEDDSNDPASDNFTLINDTWTYSDTFPVIQNSDEENVRADSIELIIQQILNNGRTVERKIRINRKTQGDS